MLFKLSLKNQKKSIRDYSIYFLTLILGVSIFYIFNSISTQTAMMEISSTKSEIIETMNTALSAMSVVVSFVLGFLIAYASQFLIKKRKKEFGLYLMLGMKKFDICKMIFIETVVIGIISLGAGLIIGIGLSQFMSLLVANLFEANMEKFIFVVSPSAILKTVIYFVIIYIVVLIMNLFTITRSKLIDLLTAHRKKEKQVVKNPVISFIVFSIACIMLGYAYYNVTAGMENLTETSDVLLQIILGIVGTFLTVWSISSLVLTITKHIPRLYHNGINSFVISEVSNKINSTVISISIICLLLFSTICLLSSSFALKNYKETELLKQAPISLTLSKEMIDGYYIKEILEYKNLDSSIYSNATDFYTYKSNEVTYKTLLGSYAEEMVENDPQMNSLMDITLPVINESDYNKVAKIYNDEIVDLEDNQYQIICNTESQTNMYNTALLKEENNIINVFNEQLYSKNNHVLEGRLSNEYYPTNYGLLVVPDSIDLSNLDYFTNYVLVDELDEETENFVISEQFDQTINPENKRWASIMIGSQQQIIDDSIGSSGMMIFISLYLGFVFMISGAALLALKQMSDTIDSKDKYAILKKLGASQKDVHNALFKQMSIFFGLPLILAVIHSIFGIQVCNFILGIYKFDGMLQSILTCSALILLIYGGYFIVSYINCKRMIR